MQAKNIEAQTYNFDANIHYCYKKDNDDRIGVNWIKLEDATIDRIYQYAKAFNEETFKITRAQAVIHSIRSDKKLIFKFNEKEQWFGFVKKLELYCQNQATQTLEDFFQGDFTEPVLLESRFIYSDAANIIALILLVAGILALSSGLCGIGIPFISSAFTSIGINSIALTVAGASMMVTSSIVYFCRFFITAEGQSGSHESNEPVKPIFS
jgi:hypothetical protein